MRASGTTTKATRKGGFFVRDQKIFVDV